jgi:phosphopantothenoylcysteine decarboxylase/phosphopantothenate--cysteine ligase
MATVSAEKLRRNGALHLELEPTEDIVREVAAAKRAGTLVVAFAAEMNADVEHAREKMRAKGADAIVLNDVSRAGIGFDSERNAATFITEKRAAEIAEGSKREVAERILDKVLGLRAAAAAEMR